MLFAYWRRPRIEPSGATQAPRRPAINAAHFWWQDPRESEFELVSWRLNHAADLEKSDSLLPRRASPRFNSTLLDATRLASGSFVRPLTG